MSLRRRAGAAFAAAGAALAVAVLPAASAGAAAPSAHTVAISVLDVSATSPVPSATPADISVQLRLTNTGSTPLEHLAIEGVRGNPIANQAALTAAIAKPAPPDPTLAGRFSAKKPITVSLPPGGEQTVDYVSTVSTSNETPGLCLCENRIYPLYFAVHASVDGGDVVVGSAQTFLVSFPAKPKPVRVGWIWPLLEPPHRGVSDDVFTDDTLADSVAGGRLSRLLSVVEAVGSQVPMTLVVDPELLDELAVMAGGHYSVQSGDTLVPGTGAASAQQWLARLRAVLDDDPGLQLALTPPSNPDISTLAAAGLDWAAQPSDAARQRIDAAIGERAGSTLVSWPARGALTASALGALTSSGVDAAVLAPSAVTGGTDPHAGTLLSLRTRAGDVDVPGTTAGVAAAARAVLPVSGRGASALPVLVAQLAVHAVAEPDAAPFVAVVPPADLDPDPAAAERAILDTTMTGWSQGVSLQDAVTGSTPLPPAGRLTQHPVAAALPTRTIEVAHEVAAQLPGLSTVFTSQDASAFDQLPRGIQRSESAAWLAEPSGSIAIADEADAQLTRLLNGVHVVRPANGTYTLGSADAPLPITVQNSLSVPVTVKVAVTATNNVLGFDARAITAQTIAPGAKLALHVPVHIDRVGRIKVQVQLQTPASTPLGIPVTLSVRSTALGEIGKVITAVAGGVLALALLLRALRGLHRRRRSRAPVAGSGAADASVPAGTAGTGTGGAAG